MLRTSIGMAVIALGIAAPASAQTHVGIRAGVSDAPGQFSMGGHIEMRPGIDHVTFRPNVELGIGQGLTTADINIEFAYWVPIERHPWSLYFGGGPAAIITSVDTGAAGRSGHVGGGFNVLIGMQHRQGLFTELKLGMMASPGVKVTVGYAFR